MEKMREEFEAWINKQGYFWVVNKEAYWEAWKASRAAQCVELPLAFSDERATTYLTRVTNALDAAGIRYV